MPELPEVEQTRLSLLPIRGKSIASVSILRADVCESFSGSGSPIQVSKNHLLQDARITELTRRGKQLAILTKDGRTLCIQLGMSGRVLLKPPPSGRGLGERCLSLTTDIPKHTHLLWCLSDNSQLLFVDPRRFGGISTYSTYESLLTHRWSALGPDAVTISAHDLASACANARRAIKAVLLDQSALAGVGNIYADESLFRAGIHPQTLALKLTPKQIAKLAAAIRHILAHAISAGGSTLRDYSDSAGKKGRAQFLHAVYGRGNQPCLTCERPLKFIRLAQRATVFCPHCQTRS